MGKSWLSCALAQKACRDGHTVHYARVPRLFADIDLAHGDGRFARLFRMLVKVDLLVLDDWGPDRLSAGQRRDLMEIVEDRHGRGSILITSQLPVATWHEVIGKPTLGDAILDRIVHNAYRLELDGPSMRKLTASEAPRRGRRPSPRAQPMASRPREQRNETQTQRPGTSPWVNRDLPRAPLRQPGGTPPARGTFLLTTKMASIVLDAEPEH